MCIVIKNVELKFIINSLTLPAYIPLYSNQYFFLQEIYFTNKFNLFFYYTVKKEKQNTLTYSNAKYCRNIKLVAIIINYCLLQFDAFKFFLGVRLHGESKSSFNFFNVNP